MTLEYAITIEYCTLCRWMLRSTWMAQELLSTFDGDLSAVTLRPASGGVFRIWVNEELIWDRKRDGGFPDIKELKQKVRDCICENRDLGHVDRK
jgi:selenoprotein W-related protein